MTFVFTFAGGAVKFVGVTGTNANAKETSHDDQEQDDQPS